MPKQPKSLSGSLGSFEVFEDKDFDPSENSAGYRGETVLLTSPHGATANLRAVLLSEDEKVVLKKLLDRNRTSYAVHGGLKSLFVLTDDETTALLGFLERI